MYERILLSIDLSDESSWQAPLEKALTLCKTFNSSLHSVNVIPDINFDVMQLYLPDDTENNLIKSASKALSAFIKDSIPNEIGAVACVGEGSIYSAILKTAEQVKSDLIIIGSHRPTMGDFLLGPNAARVVRHAACSVLVVRN